MSNRSRFAARPLTVSVTAVARTNRSFRANHELREVAELARFAAKTSAAQYQNLYSKRVSIRYSICPKCPPPNPSPHLTANKPLMFVPSWVSKCNAVASRVSFPANYSRFRYKLCRALGCSRKIFSSKESV